MKKTMFVAMMILMSVMANAQKPENSIQGDLDIINYNEDGSISIGLFGTHIVKKEKIVEFMKFFIIAKELLKTTKYYTTDVSKVIGKFENYNVIFDFNSSNPPSSKIVFKLDKEIISSYYFPSSSFDFIIYCFSKVHDEYHTKLAIYKNKLVEEQKSLDSAYEEIMKKLQ